MASVQTILRVKRRRSQDPAEALQLHSLCGAPKRGRFEESGKEAASNKEEFTFKLAATLEKDQGKDHRQLVDALKRADPKKGNRPILKERLRKDKAESVKQNRYQILKNQRQISDEDTDEAGDEKDKKIKLIDLEVTDPVEKEVVTCNGIEAKREIIAHDEDYVYDLYKTESTCTFEFDESFFNISRPMYSNTELGDEFLQFRDGGLDDFSDSDSNDENYWKNDYPDEEEYAEFAEDGQDDEYGFDNLNLDEDEDYELIHSKDFQNDANMHGESYAKYKHNIIKQLYKDDEDIDDITD